MLPWRLVAKRFLISVVDAVAWGVALEAASWVFGSWYQRSRKKVIFSPTEEELPDW